MNSEVNHETTVKILESYINNSVFSQALVVVISHSDFTLAELSLQAGIKTHALCFKDNQIYSSFESWIKQYSHENLTTRIFETDKTLKTFYRYFINVNTLDSINRQIKSIMVNSYKEEIKDSVFLKNINGIHDDSWYYHKDVWRVAL